MHTITRPIYISRQGDLFRVTAYKGWVTAPKVREFERYEEAVAYANKTFATKYYAKSCIIDETRRGQYRVQMTGAAAAAEEE